MIAREQMAMSESTKAHLDRLKARLSLARGTVLASGAVTAELLASVKGLAQPVSIGVVLFRAGEEGVEIIDHPVTCTSSLLEAIKKELEEWLTDSGRLKRSWRSG